MGVRWKTRLGKFFDRPSAVHFLRQTSRKLSAKDLEELAALTLPCHEGMRCAPLAFSGDDHSRYERNCLNLCARGRPHKLSPELRNSSRKNYLLLPSRKRKSFM